ncbi:hypothetical protein AAVH_09169 [Aphelenchoides avenae]|nr:hypothetical protein AAVH_09169 [Aphelenchus avenae]
MAILFDDDDLILDYSEDDDPAQTINDPQPEAAQVFALHSQFMIAAGNTVPFADSHLHVDESLRFALDNWTTSDVLENGAYDLAAYVAVFCRPKAYMRDHDPVGRDTMAEASRNRNIPQSLCLGATIGTHPGNAHEWSNNVATRIEELVKKGTHEGYRIIGIGEAGLDLTKSAPQRDRDGRRQNPKDADAIFNHQMPAFQGQIQLAKTLRNELGNPLPLVLHLREARSSSSKVWNHALLTLRAENLDRSHPVHCHFFEGGLEQYQEWIQFFPRTMFSINAYSLTKHLSASQLDFLRQVPMTRISFESDMPHCSITSAPFSTSANVIEAARKFQYFGRRRESLPDILRQSLINTVAFYRPDITVSKQDQQIHATTQTLSEAAQPAPECCDAKTSTDQPATSVRVTQPIFVNTHDVEQLILDDEDLDLVDELVNEDMATTPTLVVSDGSNTGWEPLGICTPNEGGHRTCRPLYVQEHFNRDYQASTTSEIAEEDRRRLFERQVQTILQSLLVLWAARLISGHADAVVKFVHRLLDSRPEDAVHVLEEHYDTITEGVQWFPAGLSESDLRLALRKRAYSCDIACNNLLRNDEDGGLPLFRSSVGHHARRKRIQNELDALWQTTPELLHWLTRYVRNSATTAEINYRILLQHEPQSLEDTDTSKPTRSVTTPSIARRIAAADKSLASPRRSRPSEQSDTRRVSPVPRRTNRKHPSPPPGEHNCRRYPVQTRFHPYSSRRRDSEEPGGSRSLARRVQW